jgi:hypothetical protein
MTLTVYRWFDCVEVQIYDFISGNYNTIQIYYNVIKLNKFYDQLIMHGATLNSVRSSNFSQYDVPSKCKVELLNWLDGLRVAGQLIGDK